MERSEFISIMNHKIKLIRTEFDLTQEKMAEAIGISKKTLVESEKGRRSLGWTEAVALTAIFADSTVLQDAFGDDLVEMVSALALEDVEVRYPRTMGGKVWWKQIKSKNGYKIQQNVISGHYRVLDPNDGRMISSFHLETVEQYLKEVAK